MIDARKGVLEQTRRHAFIASLLGVRKVVLAINKMDLVNYAQSRFDKIVCDFNALNDSLGFTEIMSIPISALLGDNIISRSDNMPWYKGMALLGYLEAVKINNDSPGPLRLPPVCTSYQQRFSWICWTHCWWWRAKWPNSKNPALWQGDND